MNSDTNLTLWNLTREHQKLLSELYDYTTGEVNEIVQAKIDALFPKVEDKCIAYTHYIRKLESEEQELEKLEKEVKRRRKAYEERIEAIKRRLQTGMESIGISKIECPYFSIRLRKNPYGTEIINDQEIPSHFIKVREKVTVEVSIDKARIKEEVLRTGIQVPGAYVSQKNKLEILIDKV